jgi:hypothetical protein
VWSEHIVTVFSACQITIKNVQVQLTVKGRATPDSYTPTPKSSCSQNVFNQMPPPSGNASATTHKTSTVDITSSPCSIWLVTWSFGVFRWRQTLARPSVGHNKKQLSSDQWTCLHVRIVHPKWSCDQSNRAWRWRNVNCGRFRARIVQHFLHQEAVQTIPWPAMSPDMNPIEHVWDFIGRKTNQRNSSDFKNF